MTNKEIEQFAKDLAREITNNQHKVLDGKWSGFDISALVEVRTLEMLNKFFKQYSTKGK